MESDQFAPSPSVADVPLSKNAQKRILKAQRREEIKAIRKAKEKEIKKSKKRSRAHEGQIHAPSRGRNSTQTTPMPFLASVVIDLAFDELMTVKECKSMASQLCHTYASNRRAIRPFNLLICTSLSGRLKCKLDDINHGAYRRWRRVMFSESGYEELCSPSANTVTVGNAGETSSQTPRFDTNQLVYLTADSENELSELKEGEVYIIGGIVDRNRYKNLCLRKAQNQRIRTARLPIGSYLSDMKTRKILTVNQVFDILLQWVETRDWELALREVMPKRKMKPSDSKEVPFVHVEDIPDQTRTDL
ncbi:guanine-1-methyltransferase-domain-containing protein [Cantharellus anzutake]|uniref:guanine-1-methyltransferase-domain-containing protein n=1 Tax=Cantharellus anzutake TaxID=1750568 RepID=UPI0019087A48|nr:guanine-1-methyltransferase-domain-containing protein [Cantharellus anzutake]KAF8335035.1 guanine-1-methyltransferase-domain-containing protein [Cantharellus anzutake]